MGSMDIAFGIGTSSLARGKDASLAKLTTFMNELFTFMVGSKVFKETYKLHHEDTVCCQLTSLLLCTSVYSDVCCGRHRYTTFTLLSITRVRRRTSMSFWISSLMKMLFRATNYGLQIYYQLFSVDILTIWSPLMIK